MIPIKGLRLECAREANWAIRAITTAELRNYGVEATIKLTMALDRGSVCHYLSSGGHGQARIELAVTLKEVRATVNWPPGTSPSSRIRSAAD